MASANMGELGVANVAVRGELRRLRGDLDKAKTISGREGKAAGRRFGQGFAASAKSAIGPAIAGALSIAAIRSFNRATKEAIDQLDNIAKSADKIGITTDALQELRVAADLSGVSAQSLDTALRRFSRAADEAAQGIKEYKETFDRLGVSVLDTNGKMKPLEDLVAEVADGMNKLDSATSKAAIAQDLFGRSGVDLINLTNSGSEGIERMRKAARDLGIVFEEDLIRETVRLKDEMTLLEKQLDKDFTEAIVRAGPLIRDFGELLVWLANRAADAREGFRRLFAGELFSTASQNLTRELGKARLELEDTQRQIDNLLEGKPASTQSALARGPGGVLSALENRVDPKQDPDAAFALLERLQNKAEETRAEIQALENELSNLGGGPTDVIAAPEPDLPGGGGGGGSGSAASEQESAFKRLKEAINGATEAERARREDAKLSIETLGLEDATREALRQRLEAERVERELLALIQENGKDLTAEEVEQLKQMVLAMRQVTMARIADEQQLRKLEEAQQQAAESERAWADAIRTTGDELVRLIDEGATWLDMLKAIATQILNMPKFQEALFGVNASGGGSGGGGLFGSLVGAVTGLFSGGGGVTTAANNPFQGASASLFTSSGAIALPSFEHGGLPPMGQFSLVGERGAELAYFDTPSRVFSNSELKDLFSNRGTERPPVSINQTLQFLDARGAKEAAGSVARRTAREVQRGGDYL